MPTLNCQDQLQYSHHHLQIQSLNQGMINSQISWCLNQGKVTRTHKNLQVKLKAYHLFCGHSPNLNPNRLSYSSPTPTSHNFVKRRWCWTQILKRWASARKTEQSWWTKSTSNMVKNVDLTSWSASAISTSNSKKDLKYAKVWKKSRCHLVLTPRTCA